MGKIFYKKAAKEKKKGAGEHKLLLYSFAVTIILYGVMIFVEKSIIISEEKIAVYVAGEYLVEDKLIDDDAEGFFRLEKRSKSSLPKGYITDFGKISGKITNRDFIENEVIIESGFVELSDKVSGINNPIEVSLNAQSLAQVVGGVLRAGDYINIWSVKGEITNGKQNSVARKICEKAYVMRTFTSTGEEVTKDSSSFSEAATIINIIIPASQEEAFNNAIVDGTIRVGRCLEDNQWQK